MWRYILLACIIDGSGLDALGQAENQFFVGEARNVNLDLTTKTGDFYIQSGHLPDVLDIRANPDEEERKYTVHNEMVDHTRHITLILEEDRQRGVGKKISQRVFGVTHAVPEHSWNILLMENKPYMLNMNYGLGNTDIDLSGIAAERLKIEAGEADVNIFYTSEIGNKIEMDTFFVKIDMGLLNIQKLNLFHSRNVFVEVGFGNMLLDLNGIPLTSSHIVGSVGAGNLVVLLPDKEVPVKIELGNSWLCNSIFPESWKKIGDNTFVNTAYENSEKPILTFKLDVSLGTILFKEKSP